MKTIEEFEAEVTAAVAKVKEDGWQIVRGWFYDLDDKTCCPLGALCITRGKVKGRNFFLEPIEDDYGEANIRAFWYNFDSNDNSDTPYAFLGRALRKELIPGFYR